MCIQKIHITGASGSGTTTLGKALAEKFDYLQFDTDNYFWLPTNPPFQKVREITERKKLLDHDMVNNQQWISSGSMCGWADFAIPYFDLVVFLFIPPDVRIQRLYDREKNRSPASFIKGTTRYKQFNEFIRWAKKYDTGGMEVRSLKMHLEMIKALKCPVLKIEGEVSITESVQKVEEYLKTI